jgi:hypothetical protein
VKMKRHFVMGLFIVSVFSVAQVPRLAAQVRTRPGSTAAVAAQAAPQADSQAVASPPAVVPTLPVPRLLKLGGVLKDDAGLPRTGVVGISFSVYKDQQGGSALWMETQNVEPDALGNYTVLLGSTHSEGMPLDLFSTGEPRWLGVKVELNNEAEQARVLLVSVPYALKASDADTLGGKPASAYLLAPQQTSGSESTKHDTVPPASGMIATSASSTKNIATPTATANYIPMFTNSSGSLSNSAIFQNASGNIGIGYTSPNARLVIAAPSGGSVLNSSNLVDQDMFITLSAPGASDKKTFFGPSTNTNLTLGVNNTEMMRITNTGNVGIGYSSPSNARLVIAAPHGGGVINSSNLVDQDMFVILTAPGASDKYAFFGPGTNTNLALGVNKTEMMRITNSGSVGIGTSTPGATLDVESSGLAVYGSSSSDTGVDGYSSGFDGGVFEAGSAGAYGSRSDSFADSSYSTGAAGWEYGTTQENVGVWGFAASGIGVGTYSEAYGASTQGTFCCAGNYPVGLWADTAGNTGSSGPGIAALTTVDTGWSIVSYSNSTYATVYLENDENSASDGTVMETYGGNFGGLCTMDVSGNLYCSGSKSAVVPVDGGSKKVALYAVEAPENWFEDAGSGQLANGSAVIHLENMFGQSVNTSIDYHVFLTPNGDCKGLYVSQKSSTSFEVHELGGGTSGVAFDYRIMAKRKGFENIRMADKTKEFAAANRPTKRPAGSRAPGPDEYRKQQLQRAQELRKKKFVTTAALVKK